MPSESRGRLGRVRLGRWFGIGGLVLGIVLFAALIQVGLALDRQNFARNELVDRVAPAALLQPQLSGAIGRQDTAASAGPAGRVAYQQAITEQARASAGMRRLLTGVPGAERAIADVTAVDAAAAQWRARYAEPLASSARRSGPPPAMTDDQPLGGVRAANAVLQKDLATLYGHLKGRLDAKLTEVYWSLAIAAAITVLAAAGLAWLIRRTVLSPLASLATNVRSVAQGDLAHPLDIAGSPEFVDLAAIIDAMRHRIIEEWRFTSDARTRLDEQAGELRRSNAELEQFAYVASHDLQEPLRKVASFCQMLERRYADRLDERGRQYIAFAVDGAKRMQGLINDLLTFSRVGRLDRRQESVSMPKALEDALFSLSQLQEETGAEVTWDDLPTLPGDQTQLTQLLQNLIGNAIKFHGEEPPRVHIGVRRDGSMWEFSCTDNGIGIEAKYADRIFLVFQRLHPHDVYPGTGIGLAMCKKIVEYHGGRIWLDVAPPAGPGKPGTTIRWTLPAGESDE
jgi:signal transduction histidine kinase